MKVYFGSHPVFLVSQTDSSISDYTDNNKHLLLTDLSEHSLNACWQLLQMPGNYPCIFQYHDLPLLKETLLTSATVIDAGGGVVFNPEGRILLIYRRDKWDLPKGKMDPGETIEECAVREVMEETGLQHLALTEKLCTSYYCYQEKEKRFVKQVHWFKMSCLGSQPLTPQAEEDITAIRWVGIHELAPYLEDTYATIKEVLLLAK